MIQTKHQLFYVHCIQDASLLSLSEPSTVANYVVQFFQGFLADGGSWFQLTYFSFILFLLQRRMIQAYAGCLTQKMFAKWFFIHPSNALSLDGSCCKLYQMYWDIIGTYKTATVLDYFMLCLRHFKVLYWFFFRLRKTPMLLGKIFSTTLLCNVSNKVLTKLLVLRFFALLPHLILPNQNEFFLGLVLYDIVLLVQGLVFYVNHCTEVVIQFLNWICLRLIIGCLVLISSDVLMLWIF